MDPVLDGDGDRRRDGGVLHRVRAGADFERRAEHDTAGKDQHIDHDHEHDGRNNHHRAPIGHDVELDDQHHHDQHHHDQHDHDQHHHDHDDHARSSATDHVRR